MDNRQFDVLLIDNDPDNLVSLKALIREGFPESRVLTAYSGQQGLDLTVAKEPDVILLDIIMPGMDEFEVCRRLKANRKSKKTVIFVTALRDDRDSQVLALQCGAEGFISKPIDEVELSAQVLAMLKIRDVNILRKNDTDK